MKFFLLSLLFFQFTFSSALANSDGMLLHRSPIGREKGITIESITYSSDGLKVSGLLFSPPTREKLPCIIFCHDGFRGISRSHRLASLRLAKRGYVVFSPSYRGEDDSEGEVEIAKGEVRDVLNTLIMVSYLEQVDNERVALVGTSHGATIALLAAERTGKPRAVVLAYGISDIYKWWAYLKETGRLGNDRITLQTYGKGPDDRPLSFSLRNGVTGVSFITCPLLIMQGEMDEVVPKEQALLLEKALRELDKPYRIRLYPHCAHGFLVYVPYLDDHTITQRERQETERAWKDLFEFLEDTLRDLKH
jgi:dipeptidyl aminopeptidase/acylaminoacyl peptidase